MSIDATSRPELRQGAYGGVRFRPRNGPPDPLHGPPNVNYPGHDGRPMADNTLQWQWIARIKGNLDAVFQDRPDVFVAGNLMWYPVEGRNRRRLAPDAMVIFGRPKGHRTSYVQHREGGIGPQVVFEVLSPSNGKRAMDYKRRVYEAYGVEEYYVFNPDKITLEVWLKEGDVFRLLPDSDGWTSPLLGTRFELGEDLAIFAPDGRPFLDLDAVARQRDEQARRADDERRRADDERRQRIESERQKIESERQRIESERQRAESERQRIESERQRIESDRRAEALAARLRALGLDPDE